MGVSINIYIERVFSLMGSHFLARRLHRMSIVRLIMLSMGVAVPQNPVATTI